MAHQHQDALELSVSQTFLAHAALAYTSPEVRTLDRIIALQSRGSLRVVTVPVHSKSLSDIPPEVLLIIRSYLIPTVTDALLSETMLAYADSLLSRARRLCGECLKYNVQVFGPDTLTWPCSRSGLTEEAQGCECGTRALSSDICITDASEWAKMDVSALKDTFEHKAGLKRGHKRTHSYSAASAAWLEEYLAKRAGQGKPIRDVIRDILGADFAGVVVDDAARYTKPSSSKADVPDAITLAVSPSLALPSGQDRLKIVARELALATTTNAGSELLTAARDMAASIIAATVTRVSCTSDVKCHVPRDTRAVRPSMFTLIGAGLALGAYTLARLAL
ncbi:hypothetical protein K488DRAFT_85586 [Vararia minispora EC-137]|uniref:Uncharacterized protein n=1 Tax=Vararia minispora EC-137 TaxID=1314806 RepID=A0ACB8QLU1_9AGAM|nr:hypothetical protein K488DRAFT_85586 [Vararia minispora EC-137]